MFNVGDYIIYGNYGVCKIDAIGTMEVSNVPKDRLYYTLSPLYSKGCKIYTPVDNQKVNMRLALTEEEAIDLIDNILEIEAVWLVDDKRREEKYKEALKTCDCKEWVKIIKTLNLKKKARQEGGKKITASDAKYLHLAEDNLYGELAVALHMDKDKIEHFITTRVEDGKEE